MHLTFFFFLAVFSTQCLGFGICQVLMQKSRTLNITTQQLLPLGLNDNFHLGSQCLLEKPFDIFYVYATRTI